MKHFITSAKNVKAFKNVARDILKIVNRNIKDNTKSCEKKQHWFPSWYFPFAANLQNCSKQLKGLQQLSPTLRPMGILPSQLLQKLGMSRKYVNNIIQDIQVAILRAQHNCWLF